MCATGRRENSGLTRTGGTWALGDTARARLGATGARGEAARARPVPQGRSKGDEKAIAAIAQRLEDSDGDVRRDAVQAMASICEKADETYQRTRSMLLTPESNPWYFKGEAGESASGLWRRRKLVRNRL